MKFTCVKDNLIKGVNIVARTAGKNISLPILNNILIIAENEGVNLSATNLEIGIKIKIRGKIEEPGKITVPAKTIAGFVGYLPEEKIEFEWLKNSTEIKIFSGQWETKIKTQSAEEYPLIPEVAKENTLKLKIKQLKELLSETIFAAVTNESRPELSGGYFKILNSELTLAATDSYRLAEKKTILSEEYKNKSHFIVPIKTLQELEKILAESADEEHIDIFWEENQILFTTSTMELNSRLINSEYPDYTQIIPIKHTTKVVFDKNQVINAVKASSLFVKTGIYDVAFEFKKPGKMFIKAANSQLGENQALVDCEIIGEENNIVFNYHYILDGLLKLTSERVVLEMMSSNNPAVLKADKKDNYLYLIMPIRQ